MLCYYCGARLQWVDARMITIIHPIAERGDKAVACRDIEACDARRKAKAEAQRRADKQS